MSKGSSSGPLIDRFNYFEVLAFDDVQISLKKACIRIMCNYTRTSTLYLFKNLHANFLGHYGVYFWKSTLLMGITNHGAPHRLRVLIKMIKHNIKE